jgi:hypothetical protein
MVLMFLVPVAGPMGCAANLWAVRARMNQADHASGTAARTQGHLEITTAFVNTLI